MTPIQISAIIALLGHSLAGLKGSPETPARCVSHKEKFLVGYCGIPQGHGFFPLWDFSKIENLSLKFREMLVGWIGRRL